MRTCAFSIVLMLVTTMIAGQTSGRSGKELGVAVAPIRIEVFSDFQCPACKTLYEKTLRPLVKDYVHSGKVYLVHRLYPLPMHAYAKEAACYACAAERVGKYEQACEVLFRQQAVWSANGKVDETVCSVLTPEEAKEVRALAKDAAVLKEVEHDVELGRRAQIRQTPTMVITHNLRRYPISGAVSYPILRRFLDNLLSR